MPYHFLQLSMFLYQLGEVSVYKFTRYDSTDISFECQNRLPEVTESLISDIYFLGAYILAAIDNQLSDCLE